MGKKELKYWLLTTEYPPFHGGGISTYCYHTAKMLTENGHKVTVFVNDPQAVGVKIEYENGVRIIRFRPDSTKAEHFLGYVTNISYEFAHIVKKFVEDDGAPDIIESQEYLGIAYYLLQYKYLGYEWCAEIPVLITMHSPSFLYLEYNHVPVYRFPEYWIGEMERFCLRAADLLISPSHYLVDEVEKRFDFLDKRPVVIANPYQKTIESQGVLKLEKGTELIFLGKLSAQKGVFKLLAYFSAMWDNGFTQPLTMIGGQDIFYHPENKTMGAFIKKIYKPYISKNLLILEDKIVPTALNRRLANAKLVIVPSTVDNLPYVVLEAMSMGLILLVSKQGGQAEIVSDGIDGFVFDHEVSKSFSGLLQRVLEMPVPHQELVKKCAQLKIEKNYSYPFIYQKKEKALFDCIEQHTRGNVFPFIRNKEIAFLSSDNNSGNGILSIVIPYYNMGKYIDQAIASIKKAVIKDHEIIIINDGSTDLESLNKLNNYRGQTHISVIDIPNSGLAAVRNLGAQIAKGQYLAFLDSDDMVCPDYYTKAIRALACKNVHFVGAWTQYFEGADKIWPTFTPEAPLLLYLNMVNSSSLVYKRQSFIDGGKNDVNMPFAGLEDYDSVVSMINNGYAGVVLPEILFFYRVRKNSMIRGVTQAKRLVLFAYMSKKYKTLYTTFATDLVNLLSANGPGIKIDNPTLDYSLTQKIPINNKAASLIIKTIKKNPAAKKIAYKIYRLINTICY